MIPGEQQPVLCVWKDAPFSLLMCMSQKQKLDGRFFAPKKQQHNNHDKGPTSKELQLRNGKRWKM